MVRKKTTVNVSDGGVIEVFLETPEGGPTRVVLDAHFGQRPLTKRQAKALARRLLALADLA